MASIDNFAVFILTHGRADRVITYKTLRKQGYTGAIYIIIDDEDETAGEYRRRFGDQVIVFDKTKASKITDAGDNFPGNRGVVFARNASFGIAQDLGLDYFLMLDDDYTDFRFKFTSSLEYIHKLDVKNLDRLFRIILEFYQDIDAITIAMGQGGDVLGGSESSTGARLWLKRKAMNSFFCSVDRPFKFYGRINEDVTMYAVLGNRGDLIFTFFNVALQQLTTQANKGGLTEFYLDIGTYVKSFYTLMYTPSFVRIYSMGRNHKRLHHQFSWKNAVPYILEDKWRKATGRELELLDTFDNE